MISILIIWLLQVACVRALSNFLIHPISNLNYWLSILLYIVDSVILDWHLIDKCYGVELAWILKTNAENIGDFVPKFWTHNPFRLSDKVQ